MPPKKALCGLKQPPRAWFDWFNSSLEFLGFFCRQANASLFGHNSARGTIFTVLYVDDIIITGDHVDYLDWVIDAASDPQFVMAW